jgi:hypothetical protein
MKRSRLRILSVAFALFSLWRWSWPTKPLEEGWVKLFNGKTYR